MRFEKLIQLILYIYLTQALVAQAHNSMEIISVSQGLPNSRINRLYLGDNGLLWIGTSNGLCFYDGYNFNITQAEPFDSTSLMDDNIRTLVQGGESKVWVLSDYGLELIDFLSGVAQKVRPIEEKTDVLDILSLATESDVFLALKKGVIRISNKNNESDTIFYSSDLHIKDAVLFGTKIILLEEQKVIILDAHTYEIKTIALKEKLIKSEKQLVSVIDSGKIIYSNNKKLKLLNINKGTEKVVFESPVSIVDISEKVNDVVVVATQRDVFYVNFSGSTEKFEQGVLFRSDGLINYQLIQDKSNLVWLATNRGIVKINPSSRKIRHTPVPLEYLVNNRLEDLIYESSNFGLGYSNSKRITSFFNTVSGKSYQLPVSYCRSIALIDSNSYLVADEKGLQQINLKNLKSHRIKQFEELEVYAIKVFDGVKYLSTSDGIYRGISRDYEKICDLLVQDFAISGNYIFYFTQAGFVSARIDSCIQEILIKDVGFSSLSGGSNILHTEDGSIWLTTSKGLYQINPFLSKQDDNYLKLVYRGNVFSMVEAKGRAEIWFASDLGIGSVNYLNHQMLFLGYEDGVRQTSFLPQGVFFGKQGELNFLTETEIISFYPDSIYRNLNVPKIYMSQVDLIGEKKSVSHILCNSDSIILLPKTRFLELSFSTFDYFAPLHTKFEYSLGKNGKTDNWREMSSNALSLGGLSPGVYNLRLRAMSSHGISSKEYKEITLIVKAPIYLSKFAFFLYGVLLVVIVFSFIHFRTRNLSRINREYKERELIAKKIEQQKEELTLKNKNITDSINYARRIQLAMMPSVRLFQTIFPDSFILHMPKDIVSGDFYWVNHVKDKIFFSAVDCTGHGVPGAFMSIIGVELFRRITEIEETSTPAEVLNNLSKNFERVFGDVDEMKLRDGMDLAFCSLNEDHTVLEYAGAFNPLYIIRDRSIIEIKGDRHSVGVYEDEDDIRTFNNHVIPLHDGDLIYVFTDGYVDQFGGAEGKKYKYRRFRHMLLAMHQFPMEKQEEYLRKSILEWKGDQEQVDDILVMGLRIRHAKK